MMNDRLSQVLAGVFALLIVGGIFAFANFSPAPKSEKTNATEIVETRSSKHPIVTQKIEGILDIQEIKSREGLKAWLVRGTSVPVITINFAFLGAGSASDPGDKIGLARLASNTMDEGAGEMSSKDFQAALQRDAIRLFFSSDRDTFGGRLKTLSKNKDRAFQLLEMAFTQPRFDEAPVARMKQANIARIRKSLSEPGWRAARIAYDTAFEGHPYAKNSGGTISGLQAITQEDLKSFTRTRLARDNLVIGISGDITIKDAGDALDSIFGALPEKAQIEDIPRTKLTNHGLSVQHELDIPQTHIQLWHPGPKRSDDYYAEKKILNSIFGGSGFGSRLMTEAREEKGLTYGIYSYFQHFDHADIFAISTSTENAKAGQMMTVIIKEIQKLRESGVTKDELESIKSYLTGSLPLKFTSNSDISGTLVSLQAEGLAIDYLDNYKKELMNADIKTINEIAKSFLDFKKFVGVTVGRPEGLDFEPDVRLKDIPGVK